MSEAEPAEIPVLIVMDLVWGWEKYVILPRSRSELFGMPCSATGPCFPIISFYNHEYNLVIAKFQTVCSHDESSIIMSNHEFASLELAKLACINHRMNHRGVVQHSVFADKEASREAKKQALAEKQKSRDVRVQTIPGHGRSSCSIFRVDIFDHSPYQCHETVSVFQCFSHSPVCA